MKTDKENLLEFVSNLTDAEITYLASRFQEIVALFEASEPPCPLGNPGLTA